MDTYRRGMISSKGKYIASCALISDTSVHDEHNKGQTNESVVDYNVVCAHHQNILYAGNLEGTKGRLKGQPKAALVSSLLSKLNHKVMIGSLKLESVVILYSQQKVINVPSEAMLTWLMQWARII